MSKLIIPIIAILAFAAGIGACPEDTKICPDGSIVVRVPPDCEFAPCPQEKAKSRTDRADGPLDTASAEITVFSLEDKIANIRIEEIRDYKRYPKANYPELKVGDVIKVKVYYLATSLPGPIIGKRYLANMSYCSTNYFGGLSCAYEGWSVALYPEYSDRVE